MLLSKDVIFRELYATYKKRVKTKHVTKESYEFERNAGVYIEKAAEEIVNKTWKVKGYFPFQVYHPNRIINAPFYSDRVVEQWYVERFIIPTFKNDIMPYNMSCQEGKGPYKNMDITIKAIEEMYKKFGTKFTVFQFDMQGYFDNISHDFAINLISSKIDREWLWLYENIVDSFDVKDGYAMLTDPEHKYGFPKGNLPSQWTGIVALNDLDHMIAEDKYCFHASRYMDDGISFYKTIGQARCAKEMTEKYLTDSKIGVRLHPIKTAYFPISRGFTYCGWRYTLDNEGKVHVRIKNEKKKEQKKRLKAISASINTNDFDKIKARRVQEGMFEYLTHGTESKNLIKYLYKTYPIP